MHALHIFKVNAKNHDDAVNKIDNHLTNYAEECEAAVDEEHPDGMYPGFDYFHIVGTINIKDDVCQHCIDEYTYHMDDRDIGWCVHFGSLDKLAKEYKLTVEQLKDNHTEDESAGDYGSPGCTCFLDYDRKGNPLKTTHIVLVDFHS